MEPVSAVILCGGQSRRMGMDKARLLWNGRDFLDRIAAQLAPADEILLSVAQPGQYGEKPFPTVIDRMPGCGPLSGLYSALTACRNDLLFAVSCDMPLVDFSAALLLLSHLEEPYDAVVPTDSSGRIQPLCALYRKRAAPVFLRQLQNHQYRLRDALSAVPTRYLPVAAPTDQMFQNLNTPQAYQDFLKQHASSNEAI